MFHIIHSFLPLHERTICQNDVDILFDGEKKVIDNKTMVHELKIGLRNCKSKRNVKSI